MKLTLFGRLSVNLSTQCKRVGVVERSVGCCALLIRRQKVCCWWSTICWRKSIDSVQRRWYCQKMSDKCEAIFGTWTSPIVSSMFTEGARSFDEIRLDPTERGKGAVYWAETRPSEAGRGVICSRYTGGKILEWTPPEFSVRTKVHEYGGGAFFVHAGVVYFSNAVDQRIYKQEAYNQAPVAVTEADVPYRYADGIFFNNFIFCVREDHTPVKQGKQAENTIVRINVQDGSQIIVAQGSDFYASPKVSSDGMSLMWMQWNHPNMPWDDTEIWIANLLENGSIQAGTERKIIGQPGVNYMQPRFSPRGKIFYISDETDWWNLYEFNDTGSHHNVQQLPKELGGPHWKFGTDAYSFDPNNSGDIAVSFDGELGIVNLKSELYYKQETGFASHRHISFGRDSCIYCIAASTHKFNAVIRWNVITGETEVIRESRESIDDAYISIPEHISFPTGEQETAYGYFYTPKNPHYKGPAKTAPPLVVIVHGGPTGMTSNNLDLRVQYLTSRGFAVLDVNYRGSVGYGKKFRQSLYGKWGKSDVDDCCAGALHLAKEHKVDGNRLCIAGRSAGGYAVLAALAFRNVFKVGVSHFGICDLEAMEMDTHKFEASYNHVLIAPYPEGAEEYRRRSPIHAVDQMNCPIAFFQGADDKVVLPNQAETMYQALLKKGIPTSLVIFPGEGHGFRIAENIQLAVDGEFYFFCKILGIPIKDMDKMPIQNLGVTINIKC